MSRVLPNETIRPRTYRHFTIAPAAPSFENKKFEFFYIGKKTTIIDNLIQSFECGYAAENPEQAKTMLKRLVASGNIPAVIFADACLGSAQLLPFSQFLLNNKHLAQLPFLLEGSLLGATDIKKLHAEHFADDVVSINELDNTQLVQKVKFWKKIKHRVSKEQQPLSEDFAPIENTPEEFIKRIFDIFISMVLMVVLSPIFLLVVIALKIESRGPVFYVSKRAGRGYNIFNFYKFRTMVASANDKISDLSHLNLYNPLRENGPVFIKIDNDPRVTKLGAFLRKCSLDELPQLLNVFKGDMSLVGNRPLPLYEAATLTTDEWAKRFMAPAGITGLWQIKKKNKYKMTAEERINLDINYADKSNFLFDLWIMANTPSAVIQRTNA
jgi:lipopolysaccharide/colanic/teichoic acid biosynthesis glycosyltransferase